MNNFNSYVSALKEKNKNDILEPKLESFITSSFHIRHHDNPMAWSLAMRLIVGKSCLKF